MRQPDTIRRSLLGGGLWGGALGALGWLSGSRGTQAQEPHHPPAASGAIEAHATHGGMITVGEVDHGRNGFDPSRMLTDWDTGSVSRTDDGRVLRTFEVVAEDKEIEIAPGLMFPAWTYNGRVPGPTLRATEGDRLRIVFRNDGSHPHSMHFHGIHSARMDGVPGAGVILPGDEFVYEFEAFPFGCHLYHCHALPLKRHIHKGMYGAFVVDAVNTVAHAYAKRPIVVDKGRPVRVYLVNVTEFDPINSFHLHGNFFDYYDHGTTLTPTLRTVDTVMQCQGQRGILEFSFEHHEPGLYMAHAHQSEFAELGWMSLFDVRGGATA